MLRSSLFLMAAILARDRAVRGAAARRGEAAADRAFERRRVGALDVVAGGEEPRRDRASAAAARPGVQAKVARFSVDRSHDLERARAGAGELRRAPGRAIAASVAAMPRSTHERGAADDEGEQPGVAAEPAAIEHELRRPGGVGAQRQHRLGQHRCRRCARRR